ncbi:MAG: molybdenum cofactor guanylyltransferase [Desulfurispora sp.]|uniref:molybdenum cofactor guanylyltransferase n=1 Tax=Desulfurispora sp. TaxID=3014275 RepID=UPI004049FB42
MGQNKANLVVRQRSLLDIMMDKMKSVFQQVMLSGSQATAYNTGLPVLDDLYPGCGPLAGIHAALKQTGGRGVFVIGCDMPLVPTALIRYICGHHDADIVVPRLGDYLEPLCAVYNNNCLPVIEQALKQGQYKITSFFPRVRVKYVTAEEISRFAPPEEAFFNINTPEDWARFCALYPELSLKR